MATLPGPVIRRSISLTVVWFTALAGLLTSVIVVPVLLLIDLVTRSGTRRTRVWGLVVSVLTMEWLGAFLGVWITIFHTGRLDAPHVQARYHRVEHWWAGRHNANFRRFAGLRWIVENPEELERGNAIVLGRHASHADAILPVILFGTVSGLEVRYTLKDELQWAPAMDIVGNRLPNVFVDRSPGNAAALEASIEALAGGLTDRQVAVIFPEGTFFTPERLDRAATRLGEHRPDLESPARTLRHLLPPRPAGTLALLRGAPEADLLLVAHEGMESFGDLAEIARNLPLDEPVRVRLWRIDRKDVPADEDAFVTWLLDRWIEVDRWIEERVRQRQSGGTPPSIAGEREILP